MRCPSCRSDASDSSAKPFCSERCRRDDLTKWFSGRYRIVGESVDPSTLSELGDLPTLESEELS